MMILWFCRALKHDTMFGMRYGRRPSTSSSLLPLVPDTSRTGSIVSDEFGDVFHSCVDKLLEHTDKYAFHARIPLAPADTVDVGFAASADDLGRIILTKNTAVRIRGSVP